MKIETVIKRLGGAKRTAELCDVSDKAVYKWKRVPPQHVVKIAARLGVRPEDLRSDVFYEAAQE